MMKQILLMIFACAFLLSCAPNPELRSPRDPVPTGLWLTEDLEYVIRIQPCAPPQSIYIAPEHCGYVHWITAGAQDKDEFNHDNNLHGRPLCGLNVMKGFMRKSKMIWGD